MEWLFLIPAVLGGIVLTIIAAGFVYGRWKGIDDVETIEDAVANAREFRNDE